MNQQALALPTVAQSALKAAEGPMDAFYWHDVLGCYVIERGDILECVEF